MFDRRQFTTALSMLAVLFLTVALLAGCSGANASGDGGVSDPEQAESANPAPVSSSSTDALGPFEEELVGTWRRYHSYDESEQYYIFTADRTGRKFEVTSGGSTTTAIIVQVETAVAANAVSLAVTAPSSNAIAPSCAESR